MRGKQPLGDGILIIMIVGFLVEIVQSCERTWTFKSYKLLLPSRLRHVSKKSTSDAHYE
jgi:hypothetical protein